jgi:8-amino-7-oxononanoate synthase
VTEPLEAADGVHVVVGGRSLVSFAGCDYLGLARHPEVVCAAADALSRCGLGAGASRTTTGTWQAHLDLERALARWLRTQDCVLLPSGWVAATALAAPLARQCDVALVDRGAHPALHEAARLSGLPVAGFAHFDARDARRAAGSRRPLVLTDSVDVACGTLAPLAALGRMAAQTGGFVVVDDAHGVGVLGPRGRGAAAAAGARPTRVLTVGSLSKALGAHGGFVAGPRGLCDRVRALFTGYAGATPIPPSTAAAAAVAVRLASRDDSLRRRLRANAAALRRRFAALGLAAPLAGLPWFAVAGPPKSRLAAAERSLRGAGFLVPHLHYFGAPEGGFLKIALSAAHEPAHVEALGGALARALGPRGPRVRR